MAFDRVLPGATTTWYTKGAPLQAGMSLVYAVDHEAQTTRALAKILRPTFAADLTIPIPRSLLDHEREILLALADANVDAIPHVLDSGFTDDTGSPFLILSVCAGQPLQFASGQSEHEALHILLQVTRILAAIHAVGIVHCDLQAANVLITEDHCVSLVDFGLARWYTRQDPDAFCNGFSPYFTAPELLRGEWGSPASDVWSIGALAWFLHLGRLPRSIGMSGYPPLLPSTTGWHKETCLLFNRCLNPRKEMRPTSLWELAEQIERMPFRSLQ